MEFYGMMKIFMIKIDRQQLIICNTKHRQTVVQVVPVKVPAPVLKMTPQLITFEFNWFNLMMIFLGGIHLSEICP